MNNILELKEPAVSLPLIKQPAKQIAFRPLAGMSSPHLQTLFACLSPGGSPPPSNQILIPLGDGDFLCCEISTPPSWEASQHTVALIHGLGGSDSSSYMVRMSRKLYQAGYRAVRINMRSCGAGSDHACRPYHGGVSDDIFMLIKNLKQQTPDSPIILIGFSLGGNVALKLAGELGVTGPEYLFATIAICPPIDLAETATIISRPENRWYNRYYMRQLEYQALRWTKGRPFTNIYEFDLLVTAPQWGFQDPFDYYKQCSSRFVLPCIKHPCKVLFACDDPFINYQTSLIHPLDPSVSIWLSPYGGHMGFLGWSGNEHSYFWLDSILFKWIREFSFFSKQ